MAEAPDLTELLAQAAAGDEAPTLHEPQWFFIAV